MTEFDRRQILKGGGAALTIGLAGCLSDGRGVPGRSPSVDEDEVENGDTGFQAQIDDFLADADNYDGTVEDMRGEDEIEIVNGVVEGAGQQWVFDPPAVQIDPGTTITWTWSGGDSHSVTHEDGEFDSGVESGDGHTFEFTFDGEGLFLYACTPHRGLGQKGAVVVGDMDGAGAPDTGNGDDFQAEVDDFLADTGNYDGTIQDFTGEGTVSVTNGVVDGTDQTWVFDPPAIEIDVGTTVEWTWSGDDSHSVTEQDGAFDSGVEGGDGHTFEHTFDEEGLFLYVCTPHEGLGQKGAVVVRGEDDGDDGVDAQGEVDDHLEDAGNYDGTIEDFTGEDSVDVVNGEVDGVDQTWVFDPPAIRVDEGTEVTWTWSGDDSHSVTEQDGAFDSGIEGGDGTTFSHTFDESGVYLYVCTPHEGLGQKGAVVVE